MFYLMGQNYFSGLGSLSHKRGILLLRGVFIQLSLFYFSFGLIQKKPRNN